MMIEDLPCHIAMIRGEIVEQEKAERYVQTQLWSSYLPVLYGSCPQWSSMSNISSEHAFLRIWIVSRGAS